MTQATRDFLEAMAKTLDTSVDMTLSSLRGGADPRTSSIPLRDFAVLRRSLSTSAETSAFERVLRTAVATTLHGVGVILDGGTHLSDQHDVRLTLDGKQLDPGLHELLISYLDQSGRAPIA